MFLTGSFNTSLFSTPRPVSYTHLERCEGFYECISAHGFGSNFHVYQDQSLDDLWFYESPPLLTWLKSLPKPTALMACDDNQGNRITEVCRVNNIRVPDKIAILGVDNDDIICNLSEPPLSSINHNIVRGGFEACLLYTSRQTPPEEFRKEAERLLNLRAELNQYIEALHKEYPFGVSRCV